MQEAAQPALLVLVPYPAACRRQVGAWWIPLGGDRDSGDEDADGEGE